MGSAARTRVFRRHCSLNSSDEFPLATTAGLPKSALSQQVSLRDVSFEHSELSTVSRVGKPFNLPHSPDNLICDAHFLGWDLPVQCTEASAPTCPVALG